MKENPLFLPKGSIRSILILLMTGWVLAALWYKIIIPESVYIVWSGMIGWYFGDRLEAKK